MFIENGIIKSPRPILITVIDNFFNPIDSCHFIKVYEDQISVEELAQKIEKDTDILISEYVVLRNDIELQSFDIVKAGDVLSFFLKIKDNQFIRIVGAVALTIVAAYAQQQWAIGYIWQAAIVIGGNYALSQAFPISLPSQNLSNNYGSGAGLSGSTNYGFSIPENAWQEGTPLPDLIGERLVTPPRIALYRHLPIDENEMQHLRMLFAICGSPIDDLNDSDIYINGKAITDYPSIVYDYTTGSDSETRIIPWFSSGTPTEQQLGTTLPDNEIVHDSQVNYIFTADNDFVPVTYHSITQTVTCISFELQITYPFMHVFFCECEVYLHYRETGDSAWEEKVWTADLSNMKFQIDYAASKVMYTGTFSLREIVSSDYELRFAIDSEGKWVYDSDLDVSIKKVIGYSSLGSIPTISSNGTDVTRIGVGLLLPNGIYYVSNDGTFAKHSVKIMVALRPYGESEWVFSKIINITDSTNEPIRRFVLFENLDADQWEVQIFISGTMPTSNRYMHDCQIEYLQEGIALNFSYPGVSLLAIDYEATETYQNIPVVSVKAKRQDYDSVSSSTNVAWAAYYRLIDVYGEDPDDIDFQSFSDWADFCDEKDFTCGFYLDSKLTMKDVLDQLGAAGGARIRKKYGRTWYALVDNIKSPVQLFCSDNMVQDSFETGYIDASELANTVLCWYFDEDLEYVRTPIEVYDSVLVADEGRKTSEIVLYAVTKRDQAKAIAIKELNKNRLMRKPATWIAEKDAMNCDVGDVVYVQNNLPLWGISPGSVVSATSNTVTCLFSKDFDDSDWSSRDLRILIRHMTADSGGTVDHIERHTIVNPYPNTGVTTYTLSGSSFDRIPDEHSLVVIAWVTDDADSSSDDELLSAKMFQITKISRRGTENTQNKIEAIEYYREAYNYDYIITDAPAAESGLSVGNVSSSTAWRFQGRTHEDRITLTWTGDALHYYIFYRYQLEDSSGSEYSNWRFYKSVDGNAIEITDLSIGKTYEFSVSVYNFVDTSHTVIVDFDTYDHADLLEAPTGLQCVATGNQTWTAKDLLLEWNDSTLLFDVKRYKIKIWNDAESAILNTYYSEKSNQFNYSIDLNAQDHSGTPSASVKVQITVVDNLDNEENTTITEFTNAAPSTPSGLTTTQFMNGIKWTWNVSTDEAFSYYYVRYQVEAEGYSGWMKRTSPDFTVFLDETQSEAYKPTATIYIQVQQVDVFEQPSSSASDNEDTGGLTIPSTAISDFSQISAGFPEIPVLRNITWSDNTPSSGYIQWSAGSLYYNGTEYNISSNNTNTTWVYWDPNGTITIFVGTDDSTTIPAGSHVIAVNNSGSADIVWSNAVANGVFGSAWIRDLAVTNAKINDLDAAKLQAGTLLVTSFASATQSAALNSYNVQSGNLCPNSNFDAELNGWTTYENCTSPITFDIDFSVDWTLLNSHTAYIYQNGIDGGPTTYYAQYFSDYIPVNVGDRYCASVFSGAHRADVRIYIVWYDNTDTSISNDSDASTALNESESTGGKTLSGYKRIYTFGTAPAGAANCKILLRKWDTDTGETTSFAFFSNVMFSEVGADQTDPPPYSISREVIPSYFKGTAPDNSIAIDGTYIGIHATGSTWPVQLSANGGDGYFFCGNANYYLLFDGTDFEGVFEKLYIETTEGLEISSGASVLFNGGTDLDLEGSDTDPGKINYIGTSYTVTIGGNADGSDFFISPDTNDVVDLIIGGSFWSSDNFNNVQINVGTQFKASCDNSYYSLLSDEHTFYVQSSTNTGGVVLELSGSQAVLRPLFNKDTDLGYSILAFDDLYYDDATNVADIPFLDTVDDLTLINNIRSSKKVNDEGLYIIDDDTLPELLLKRHKRDGGDNKWTWKGGIPSYAKHWHWAHDNDYLWHWKKGDFALTRDRKPFISKRTESGLFYGSHRAHDAWAQDLAVMIEEINYRLLLIEKWRKAQHV